MRDSFKYHSIACWAIKEAPSWLFIPSDCWELKRDQRNNTVAWSKRIDLRGSATIGSGAIPNAIVRRRLVFRQRRLSSCKRNRWRAFTVTTSGWVLMFSKLFRVHRTRYKQKCIKVHSDPWLIDRLINLLYHRLLGFHFIKDSTRFRSNLLDFHAKLTSDVNIEFFLQRVCVFVKQRITKKILLRKDLIKIIECFYAFWNEGWNYFCDYIIRALQMTGFKKLLDKHNHKNWNRKHI